jgi:hypothetical protein
MTIPTLGRDRICPTFQERHAISVFSGEVPSWRTRWLLDTSSTARS